ncbi:MAG: SDR family oxidoreductase [Planctomycetaceae bacterium]
MSHAVALAGRIALVTGAGVRIGRAIALELGRQGADVCVHYAGSEAAAHEVVSQLTSLGRRSIAVQSDLMAAPVKGARQLITDAAAALGPIDLLVNSAAIFREGTLDGTSETDWDQQFNLNLKAPVWLTQEFVRQLPAGRRGDVINIVDWRAARPVPGHLAYTAAKAGLLAMTKLLAQEVGTRAHVNAIAPGAILPPPGADQDAWEERITRRIPLGHVGAPDDIARGVTYLATAGFVNGEVLHVTGGEQL